MPTSGNRILRVTQNCRSVFVGFYIEASPAFLRTELSTGTQKFFVRIPKSTGIVADNSSNSGIRDEMQVFVVNKYEFGFAVLENVSDFWSSETRVDRGNDGASGENTKVGICKPGSVCMGQDMTGTFTRNHGAYRGGE